MFAYLLCVLLSVHASSSWNPTTSKLYSGTNHTVTERYIPVPLDHSSSGGSTLNLYVRRFAQGKPKKHVFLISGGPGQSGRVYEPFVNRFTDINDCWIYAIDHRGTGKSGKLSKRREFALNPGSCPQADSLKYYSVANAVKDLVMAAELVKREDGGEVFGVSSSYGTLVLYRAMRLKPQLFAGIILNDFYPTFQPVIADINEQFVELCREDPNCRARFPSSDKVHSVMRDVSRPGLNECTKHFRSLEIWDHYGDSGDLGPLVQRFFGMILEALEVESNGVNLSNPLLVAFSFLYQLHRCGDKTKFAQMVTDLENLFIKEGLITITTSSRPAGSAPRQGLVPENAPEAFENHYRGGPSHMNGLINNYINYSESHASNFSTCSAQSKTQLYSDCLSNSAFVEQRKKRYESYAYKPEPLGIDGVSTSSRVIVVGGQVDPQTPLAISKLAADKISASGGKLFLKVKHSAHGSMGNSGCSNEILRAMLNGKTSAAESCVKKSNNSRKYNWADYPGFSQYLWPMDQKADLETSSSGRMWLWIGLGIGGGVLLIGGIILGVWLWRRRKV